MVTLPSQPPVQVGVREVRANFSRYLRQARAGTPVVIKSRGEPDVELVVRVPAPLGPRPMGSMNGRIKFLSPDWEETDPEVVRLMTQGD
jgi:prevent-host-death family protein